ncbi:MAG: cache domain-containing protein [Methyloceanibacter sp.]
MSLSAPRFPLGPAALLVAALSVFGGLASAATGATKDEAVAMVKKAVAYIKTDGPDKAYPAISNPTGEFVDRDLYIVVYGLDGVVLAHGANAKRIGTNQIDDKDPDGKAFVKERVELAATHPSFWQSYKFMNPVTQKVEPKEMYCERLDQTVVCGGVYQL